LRVKDAIVDQFRDNEGRRPSIDTEQPDIRIHLHLQGAKAQLAIDLSGGGLHRRGYRVESGVAPLRETLAAAMLQFAGWPNPRRFESLLDPLCGSATLPIEAAMMAGDVAPGLDRAHFGFVSWPGHESSNWETLLDEALERRARGASKIPPIIGSDHDVSVMAIAMRNVQRAGFARSIELRTCELSAYQHDNRLPARGLLVANPPYGPRMEPHEATQCARQLRALCSGALARWSKTILMLDQPGWPQAHNSDDPQQTPGDTSSESLAVNNGALACRIHNLQGHAARKLGHRQVVAAAHGVEIDTSELTNRIAKNERKLRAWRKRDSVTCYRVYDADLPQFALAIDIYHTIDPGTIDPEQRWVLVQEYAAPARIDPAMAATRREAALTVLPAALGVAKEHLLFKTRERQRGATQYQRQQHLDQYHSIVENGARLLVNLHDFVDTGLFLDHRPLRRWIREHSAGTRFLNLFAYTGSASVHAAAGGATHTLSVDMSALYSRWSERNLRLNDFHAPAHRVVRADCIEWLASDEAKSAGPFDLIFLDPPTFSNSKRMSGSFEVQRDHVPLIQSAMTIMAPQGALLFSSNRRGMHLDETALQDLHIKDWTKPSVPADFARGAPPHRCWMIRKMA
jgi:23S rRNA (guanine2445-N2)-methyltransferase / 23S rRNA (guanine2069-N7)-methyltransferase